MLCFRCQHRLEYIEAVYNDAKYKPRPRMECGDPNISKHSCYMFKPQKPLELEQADPKDSRSPFLPAILAGRSCPVRESDLNSKLTVKFTSDKSWVLQWKFRSARKANNLTKRKVATKATKSRKVKGLK